MSQSGQTLIRPTSTALDEASGITTAPKAVANGCPRCERLLMRDGEEDLCIACGFRRERLAAVTAFVLAGGRGVRLGLLSRTRAKPALPFGTERPLIDFTLQNCERSGLPLAFVLGQYRWRSVQQAVRATRAAAARRSTRLYLRVSPSARGLGGNVYRGTADAVRQNLDVVGPKVKDVLVLAGDHVYDMDYRPLVAAHRSTGAGVTVAVAPVDSSESHRFGMVHLGSDDFLTAFDEKPAVSTAPFASMGIYVFDAAVLRRLLQGEGAARDDFGHQVLPAALAGDIGVGGYVFEGYWRDVGSVESYWSSSIERMASEGEATSHQGIERSVVSPLATIEPGAIIRDSVILDGAQVGRGAIVQGAIVDEQSVIGRRARVGTVAAKDAPHRPTVVGRKAVIAEGERIGPGAAVAHDGKRTVVDA